MIEGVPAQFDDFVACATARDPADRYADAIEMAAEVDAIAEELDLPDFRVPAPRNSAQHRSAALHHSRMSSRSAAAAAATAREGAGAQPDPPIHPGPGTGRSRRKAESTPNPTTNTNTSLSQANSPESR